MLLLCLLSFLAAGCKEKTDEPVKKDVWDIDNEPIPKFVAQNYIELDKIYRISRYRSSIGHDYSDAFEHCRSMKHYFEPRADADWTNIKIFSPVSGSITRVEQEWAGIKLEIESEDYPAFRFSIFHLNPLVEFHISDLVLSGEELGTHIGFQTMSDISVIVNDPTRQGRMISFFEVISDELFTKYSARGVFSREEFIISKEIRDANPLECTGEQFITTTDTIENWVILK